MEISPLISLLNMQKINSAACYCLIETEDDWIYKYKFGRLECGLLGTWKFIVQPHPSPTLKKEIASRVYAYILPSSI